VRALRCALPPHGAGVIRGPVPQARFVSFLRRSLDALARERPDVARRLAAEIGPLAVAIEVDGDRALLSSDGRTVRCDQDARDAAVDVRADLTTLLALIDGETSLEDAVLAERVLLRGDAPDLARFHDALWLYLQGAVRAPSFPALLAELRA
jgi:hypothetical protein